MSARDELVARFQRLADKVAPDLRTAFLRAVRNLSAAISDAKLEKLLAAGDPDQVIRAVFDSVEGRAALHGLDLALNHALITEGMLVSRTLLAPKAVGFEWQSLSPRVIEAAQVMRSEYLTTLTADMRTGLRQAIETGLRSGVGPRTTAIGIRRVIGFTDYDQAIIQSFETALRTGNPSALARELRDARFDGTIRKAFAEGKGLTEAQVRTYTDAYARRLKALRAETYARTTSIDALRRAQVASWKQAADRGLVRLSDLTKRWVTRMDGRERPEHGAMNNTVIPFNDLFVVPKYGPMFVPSGWNCRCTMFVRPAA